MCVRVPRWFLAPQRAWAGVQGRTCGMREKVTDVGHLPPTESGRAQAGD